MKEKRKRVTILMTVKYSVSVIFVLYAFYVTGIKRMAAIGFLELVVIFLISNIIIEKRHINWVANSIMLSLFNIQYAVLSFGGSFIQYVMLTNLNSIEDLGGKSQLYILVGAIILFSAILPIRRIRIKNQKIVTVAFSLVYIMTVYQLDLSTYSPAANYLGIGGEFLEQYKVARRIEKMDVGDDFYRKTIKDYRSKPDEYPDDPNVIVIFTEGLSECIIDDERNIMPNVKRLKEKSLTFENYFNHTAPTYKGLIGQLTSGYQRKNLDRTGLTTLNQIFRDEGYSTTFVNVEPNNKEFTDYLKDLDFDDVVTDTERATSIADAMSDKNAYELLWETATKMDKEKPFFLGIYTFGTHVSFYSPDEQFENTGNDYLSKFYNADYWFGDFLDKFNKSELSDNTLLIFTTDHASWQDPDFVENFSNNLDNRGDFTDTIPLYLYFKNRGVEKIDAKGRNSLDFAPTICDLLDIDHENYFLGESLFNEKSDVYFDKMTSYEGVRVTTRNGKVEELNETDDATFSELLERYYAVKKKSAEAKGLKDREGLG